MAILPLPLIQEEQLSVNGERITTLSTGKLPLIDSVVRITDCPDMTSAVTVDLKLQISQTNKQLSTVEIVNVLSVIFLINKYCFRP